MVGSMSILTEIPSIVIVHVIAMSEADIAINQFHLVTSGYLARLFLQNYPKPPFE